MNKPSSTKNYADLVRTLCRPNGESEWVEHKQNQADPTQIGPVTRPLRDMPERERALWRTFDRTPYETRTVSDDLSAEQALGFLDWPAYFRLLKRPLAQNPLATAGSLALEGMLERAGSRSWSITNLGALLLAVRELIANMLVHQGLNVTGAGPMVEIFSDRIETSNPGESLVAPDRLIDAPPRTRNEALEAGMIVVEDPEAGTRRRSYLPFWTAPPADQSG